MSLRNLILLFFKFERTFINNRKSRNICNQVELKGLLLVSTLNAQSFLVFKIFTFQLSRFTGGVQTVSILRSASLEVLLGPVHMRRDISGARDNSVLRDISGRAKFLYIYFMFQAFRSHEAETTRGCEISRSGR